MNGKQFLAIVVSLTALLASASFVAAVVETTGGTIEAVEMEGGHFVLETDDGRTVTLTASPELLMGLKAGDEVEVDIEDGRLAKAVRDTDDDETEQSPKPDKSETDTDSSGSGGTSSRPSTQ